MDVPAVANVLGTIGAVCWSIQLMPQIIMNYRRHDTEGLQGSMMISWAFAGVPLGVYNIVEEFNIALRIQPQILTFLSLVTWAQCLYYGRKLSTIKCLVSVIPFLAVLGGIEVALVFALRIAKDRHGLEWPSILMATLSACLLAAGVLRHYWDIYLHRTVRGISFLFVGIDAAGDLFSLVSVLFEPSINPLGIVIYATEFTLWLGVFICGGVFNLPAWLCEKRHSKETETREDSSPNQAGRGSGRGNGQIAIYEMPSSTSVFRTASGSEVIRRRIPGD